jgi:tRNA (cmo5U34)-methyltransferase
VRDRHDNTLPEGKWTFDAEVTDVFEDMLKRSIPQYDVMRQAVFHLACSFLDKYDDGWVVDLGCSRGDTLAPLVEKYGERLRYFGCDVSKPMLEACRLRFEALIEHEVVRIASLDLRREYPGVPARVTTAVLCLQFIPLEYRQRLVGEAYRQTLPGGAFIIVEKVLGNSASLNDLMTAEYLAMKSRNDYTQEQIDRKRLSLEGVLVPVTSRWNEELLRQAGFRDIDCFWRWMNFSGWVAVKEP